MEWLGDNLWLGWMALALVLVLVEVVTLDVLFFLLGVGVLCGGFAAALGAPLAVQIVVAVVVALLLVLLVRPRLRARFLDSGDTPEQR